MKISDSLEQLALYNLRKKTSSGQVDLATEKLKRFNTILKMFSEDNGGRKAESSLSALEILASPVRSNSYGRVLQALSAEMIKRNASDPVAEFRAAGEAGLPAMAKKIDNRANLFRAPDTDHGEKEMIQKSVTKAAEKYGLPESLIKGVIKAESAFNTQAVSAAGAQGLMQLMPGTARELGVTDSFDIDQNIDGGARYLKKMLHRFEGDVEKALAAYNAGPGTVERYGGKVPYRETIAYVNRVLKYSQAAA